MKRLALLLLALLPLSAFAQDDAGGGKELYKPVIGGTVRAKYEWQTEIGKGRFQVRTARLSVKGKVLPNVDYKAEVDLSDKGEIRMLDAYTDISFLRDWTFKIGQMRVPFSIDAHRSPYSQYFPNRSFLAKEVGDVRDVGATLTYSIPAAFPIKLEAGIFNGSGITNQDDFWTNVVNFSSKAQFFFPKGFNLTLSVQKIEPDEIPIWMYDAGGYWQKGPWHLEAEYLFKHYKGNAFHDVNTFNLFGSYDIHLRNSVFHTLSLLARYDYMDDHSHGIRFNADGVPDPEGFLIANDAKRSRVTAGLTLFFDKDKLKSAIRLNYEKYIYPGGVTPKVSERDKLVLEFMTHF